MTKLPFTINGEDFSDIVHKYGYATDTIPVYSRVVTTMDQVGRDMGLSIRVQREDIFEAMHRI